MRSFALVASLILAGASCTADAPSQSGPKTCTGALYDPCFDEHNCSSGLCGGFGDLMPTCSQACTQGGEPCPDQDGQAVPCDDNGLCHPAMSTDCTLSP